MRRARPVVLTALAAVLAFLPLSLSSFWGPLAIVLIGGTIVGTALTLFFLPVLYALVFRLPRAAPRSHQSRTRSNDAASPQKTTLASGAGMASTRTRLALAALAAASFATGTEAYVYVSQLERLAGDLRTDLAATGALSAAFAITYAIFAPLVAAKTTNVDRRMLVVFGLAAIGGLNLLATTARSFEALVAIRIGCGLAAATAGPAASAAAAALVPPERRGRAMATVLAGLTLAFVLGIPLGSVIGSVGGWRATFGFAGLIALCAAAFVRLALPRVAPTGASSLRRPAIGLRPDVALTLALTAVGFAATFCVVAYIAPIGAHVAGVRGAGVGGLQALIGVGSIAGVVFGGRLADREDGAPLILMTFAASAVALCLYSVIPMLGLDYRAALGLLIVGMVAGSAALFTRTPLIQARLVRLDPEQTQVLLALNGSMVFAGQGLGAAVGGLAISANGVGALGIAGAAVAVVGALMTIKSAWSRPRLAAVTTAT